MGNILEVARSLATSVSPRHRRWQALLRSCTLTPSAAGADLATSEVILCGCSRSGTALVTAALFQPPTMVTVMEPWDGLRLTPRDLFASLRSELASGSLERGRLRIDDLRKSGAVNWQRDAERSFPVNVDDKTLLGVKWPSYWQLLGRLPNTKFIVCIRDPAEVVASFAAKGGRLGRGLDYDVAFTQELNDRLLAAHSADEARRIGMYDAVYEHVLAHTPDPNVFLVRYERWFTEPHTLLEELSTFLDADLTHSMAKIHNQPTKLNADEAARVRAASTTAERLGYR